MTPYCFVGSVIAAILAAVRRSRSARRCCFALRRGLASFFSRATFLRWRRSRSALVIAPDFLSGGRPTFSSLFRVGDAETETGPFAAGRSSARLLLDRIGFNQVALALDREPCRGRRDPDAAKMRLSGSVKRHSDAEPVKLFERGFGQAARRDREAAGMIRRRWTVGP